MVLTLCIVNSSVDTYNPTNLKTSPVGVSFHFAFTGIDPRKGWRTPLDKNRYSEQRDEETGYGFFGARYMDHELMTMWLSVDPMADKYPSLSPYNYCAWNPVKLVDPDGRELYIPNSQSTNHEGSWKDLLSLLVHKGNSKYIQVGTDGKISIDFGNKTQKQIDNILRDDNGLNLLNMLVSSDKKYFYESSDDATSVYNDGMSHSMANEHKGIINASNGGLDSRNAYTHTPKSGFDGHIILAKSGKWLRTDDNGFNQDLRRPILFHELAENYFRTDGLQNYELAHKSAKRLEGFSMHNHSPGEIPRATYNHPNQGYYFGGIHRF